MATVNFIPYARQSAGALSAVTQYVERKDKTVSEQHQLVSGQNCTPAFALQEFLATRQAYRKESPVWFYHYTQAFAPDAEVTGAQAHAIAKEFAAQAWPESEVLIATHIDATHIHSHFIVNAVCYETGKMLRQGPNTIQRLRGISDAICLSHGLNVLPPGAQKTVKGMSAREFRAASKGQSWKFQLMCAIDGCMERAWSQKEFIEQMHRLGYEVRWTDARANITYTVPGGMKCRDNKLHQEKYLKENIQNEFAYRAEIYRGAESSTQPLLGRGERGGVVLLGVGEELERGAEPALRYELTATRNTGGARSASDETRRRGDAESDSPKHTAAAAVHERPDGTVLTTGWEHEREVLLGRRRPGHEYGKSAPHHGEHDGEQFAGDVPKDRFGAQGSGPYGPEMAGGAGTGLYRSGAVGRGTLFRGHPAAAGVGAAVGAFAALDGDGSDDPEEQRRRIEAQEAAENFGTIVGLAAGLISAAAGGDGNSANEESTQNENQYGPKMAGM